MNGMMINTAEQVCGRIKGPKRHKKTWWWNRGFSCWKWEDTSVQEMV